MTAARSGRPRVASLRVAFAAGVAALLSACGTSTNFNPGTPVLTLSSTNTRFAAYFVAIDFITFSGPNGVYGVALPSPVTIDLTRPTDISELLSAAAVPQATFTSATLTFDYTNANIWVNNNGLSVHVTPTVLVGGNSVLSTAVVVTFDPNRPLVITNQQSVHAQINLDLDAFNSIDLPNLAVTVQPYAVMNPPQPQLDQSSMRARGVFVYTGTNSFIMNVMPFYSFINPVGGLTVDVGPQTYYNIFGVTYVGAAGLAAMTPQPINTPVAVYGTLSSLSGVTPTFTATSVYVGSSFQNPLLDYITGVVVKRSGDSLTVIGGNYRVATGGNSLYLPVTQQYNALATVKMGSGTIVSEDGVAGTFGLDSISVGQKIDAGGVSSFGSAGYLTLDASGGQIRLQSTRAWGVLNPAPTPNSFSLDLDTLGGWQAPLFNFDGAASGGGAILPADYPVNSGSSDQSGTAAGTLLAVDGLVAPFGTAPPAFNATAVTPGASTQQELVVEWVAPGTAKPFSSISPTGLVLDLNNAALSPVHAIYTGPVPIDLKSLPTGLVITSVGANQNQLSLSVGGTILATGVSVFSDPATAATDYSALLTSTFAGTHTAIHLVAFGNYNSASNTFIATRIEVGLQN
jgi:hypothetical protein